MAVKLGLVAAGFAMYAYEDRRDDWNIHLAKVCERNMRRVMLNEMLTWVHSLHWVKVEAVKGEKEVVFSWDGRRDRRRWARGQRNCECDGKKGRCEGFSEELRQIICHRPRTETV